MVSEVIIKPWACQRCEYTWIPRTVNVPKQCPGCKSLYWNKPRRGQAVGNLRKLKERISG